MFLNIFVILFHTVYCFIDGWDLKQTNYTILEITAFNSQERAALYHMQTTDDEVIFLNGVTNIVSFPMYVMVSDYNTNKFKLGLDQHGIEYVQVLKDSVLEQFKQTVNIPDYNDDYDDLKIYAPTLNKEFLSWPEIRLWVKHELKKYPSLKKITIGHTFEGKELFVLKISSGGKKPGVFILGGEQGRDKMSVSVVLNFIDSILTTKVYEILINVYDLYFMPVFNPDGYAYSMKTEWFWNKNRKIFFPEKICSNNEKAIGVNIDRNWFMSNSVYVEGAECDSVFIGHEALTEEEPRALALYLNTLAEDLMGFINVMGYGSLLTVPYAEDKKFANNYAVLSEMLLHASNAAFLKYNVSSNLCSTHNCLYNYTGNAPDWVKKNMNIPVVFTIYLRHINSFLPRIEHVPTLVRHFSIVIKETLLLAFDIYGPLFNCAVQLPHLFLTVFQLILVLFLKKIIVT